MPWPCVLLITGWRKNKTENNFPIHERLSSIRFGPEILSNIEEQTAEYNSFKQTKILLALVRLKGYFFKEVSTNLRDLEGVIFILLNILHFHYVLDMLLDET